MMSTTKVLRLVQDLRKYEIAANNFRTSYRAYPGDSPLFIPPGNLTEALGVVGGGACAAAPNGLYSNAETNQFFGHLSQASMVDKHYPIFSPSSCGGPHYTLWRDPSNAGLMYPYTDTEGATTAGLIFTKYPFQPNKSSADNSLNFLLYIKASYVIPLEAKIGTTTVNTVGFGLFNANGIGKCVNATDVAVSCNSSTAKLGNVLYLIAPI